MVTAQAEDQVSVESVNQDQGLNISYKGNLHDWKWQSSLLEVFYQQFIQLSL